MKLWLLTGIKVQRKQTFLYRRQHFNLTNYTATVQSSQFNKNLGLQIKNLAGNSFPGRSTQWWLTNRVRCTSLALWDRAKWTCRISLHVRGAHRFWCRRVRSMSMCTFSRQLLLVLDVSWRAGELRPLSWDGSSPRLMTYWSRVLKKEEFLVTVRFSFWAVIMLPFLSTTVKGVGS